MPSIFNIGVINSSAPQQNAMGVYLGELNMTGWDANQKVNSAQGGQSSCRGFLRATYVLYQTENCSKKAISDQR